LSRHGGGRADVTDPTFTFAATGGRRAERTRRLIRSACVPIDAESGRRLGGGGRRQRCFPDSASSVDVRRVMLIDGDTTTPAAGASSTDAARHVAAAAAAAVADDHADAWQRRTHRWTAVVVNRAFVYERLYFITK